MNWHYLHLHIYTYKIQSNYTLIIILFRIDKYLTPFIVVVIVMSIGILSIIGYFIVYKKIVKRNNHSDYEVSERNSEVLQDVNGCK